MAVRYYTDILTEQKLAVRLNLDGSIAQCRTDYNIDLPVPVPTGEALHTYIMTRAPQTWLETMEKIEDTAIDTSMSAIAPLIGVEFTSGPAQ